MTRSLACAALVAVAAAGHGGPAHAQLRRLPPGAAILGQVLDVQTGRGLDRAVVEVDGAGLRRRLVSDSRGRFLFTGLPAGEYVVTANRTGFLSGVFGQRRPAGAGSAVPVTDGQWLSGVDITLWRPAVITGDVRDERGEPMIGVTVRAYKHDRLPTHATLREVARALTDDTGRYRLQPLTPGEHLVGISTQADPLTTGIPEPDAVFAPQYYPGADRVVAASLVTVEAGREFTGIGFMLFSTPLLSVAGRVDLANVPEDRAGAVRLLLARPRDPSVAEPLEHRVMAATTPDAEGRFFFAEVPAGDYVVEATVVIGSQAEGSTETPAVLWASTPIAVTDKPLSDVTVALQRGLAVEGRVQLSSRNRRSSVPPGKIVVHLEPLFDGPDLREARATLDEDGTFRFAPALLPGRYLVSVSGIPPGLMLRSVVSGGIDVSDQALDLTFGFGVNDVFVELTDELTLLTGTVRGDGPVADPSSTVLLFPQREGPGGARRVRSIRTTPDGLFSFRNLPAGNYLMVAIDEAQAEGWQAPDRMQALRIRATPVTLREGEVKVQDLKRILLR